MRVELCVCVYVFVCVYVCVNVSVFVCLDVFIIARHIYPDFVCRKIFSFERTIKDPTYGGKIPYQQILKPYRRMLNFFALNL